MLEPLTPTSFEPHVGSRFTIDLEHEGAERVVLVLAAVERQPTRAHGERTDPFSLVFSGPAEPALPQATYPLEHDVLGRIQIFVVPIGPDRTGAPRYEAVFN